LGWPPQPARREERADCARRGPDAADVESVFPVSRTASRALGRISGMIRALFLIFLTAATLTAQTPASSTAIGEWPTYGGDLANSKYSPLDQITAANFASLKVAWSAKSPDGFLSMTLPDGTEWSADSKLIFAELSRIDPK